MDHSKNPRRGNGEGQSVSQGGDTSVPIIADAITPETLSRDIGGLQLHLYEIRALIASIEEHSDHLNSSDPAVNRAICHIDALARVTMATIERGLVLSEDIELAAYRLTGGANG